ncbi:MAG: biotin/lipoyl-containing protein [Thermoplasmata archaeon]
MRVRIVRDGDSGTAEVADDLSSVTVGGRSFPVRIVAQTPIRVELEIAGERVTIDGWPDRYPIPPTPVDVDGERWAVSIEIDSTAPPSRSPSAPSAPAPGPTPPGAGGPGVAVLPPMPGKIVELRVKEGQRVTQGQVLLVLEAMKMRNEIASPADGTVRRLAVSVGANVRAHEPMLFVEPE